MKSKAQMSSIMKRQNAVYQDPLSDLLLEFRFSQRIDSQTFSDVFRRFFKILDLFLFPVVT